MNRILINVLIALALMLIQTNVDAAFGIQAMVQFGIIAVVISGMTSMNIGPTAICMVIFALICDVFASGPVGLYAFAFMLTFGFARALIYRFRSERLIIVMAFCGLMSVVFEFLLAGFYAGYYRNLVYFSIFGRIFWKDLILTILFSPVVLWLGQAFESLSIKRKKTGLM